jgi:DNA repair exonuclease SbcCD ATPase subunit
MSDQEQQKMSDQERRQKRLEQKIQFCNDRIDELKADKAKLEGCDCEQAEQCKTRIDAAIADLETHKVTFTNDYNEYLESKAIKDNKQSTIEALNYSQDVIDVIKKYGLF